MAKVPPQFAKKSSVDTRGKGNIQPGSKTPDYAPNASQDPALMVARDALVTPKKAPVAKKGMKPC